MPSRSLPAASLRTANSLPVGRLMLLVSNYMIYTTLWSLWRAILGREAKFLPALREAAGSAIALMGLRPRRLRPQYQPLLGDDRTGPGDRRIGGYLVHEGIIVTGVMVKDHQGPDPCGVGQANALLPGRMTPVLVLGEFGVGVGGIVDHHIGGIDQLQDIGIEPARQMLGIGDVGHDLAAIFDPVAGGVVWVVERPGGDANPGMRGQSRTRGKVDELDVGGEDSHRDRKQRRDHHVVEHRLDALAVQVTGPDPDLAAPVVARRKERQSADVVKMRVAVEQVA